MTSLVMLGLVAGAGLLAPEFATAAPKDEICEGVGAVTSGGCRQDSGNSLNDIVALVIDILSRIIGIVAVIMIIVGGFKYITSGGDSGKVSSAKTTIIYALVGLLIVAFAQTIVWFILQRTTETDKEREERENSYLMPPLATTSRYYTIEFNNKSVL